jgi:class 3 adenylate cyclase
VGRRADRVTALTAARVVRNPHVRIGLHTAAAQRHDGAYRGQGVHVAARIAALAEAGEILASRETTAGADAWEDGLRPLSPQRRAVTYDRTCEPLRGFLT